MPIIVGGHFLFLNWELIHPATAHRGGGFRPENEALRLLGDKFVIEMYAIVEAWNIKCSVKSTLGIGLGIIATAGHGACIVDLVTVVGHIFCPLGALLVPLFWNFVTDAPHHDRRVVAVSAYQVFEVFTPPLIVKQVVAVFHLGFFPCVEALGHHHHTH